MAKGWHFAWNAPSHVMVAGPMQLSIERAKDPPARARIEVYESDAIKHEVDDYNDELKELKGPTDDLVAKFDGTLVPRPGPKGGYHFVYESGGPELSKEQANDYVEVTFEGSKQKFECGIPGGTDEPVDGNSDGGFYELYAEIHDADAVAGGDPLATTHVHLVRRRTDLLLAIEPLNQCGATLTGNPMGKMILQFFQGGNNATAKRKWGDTVIGTHEGDPVKKTLCQSGCSYIVLTMMLRYLRRPKPASAPAGDEPDPAAGSPPPALREWITIFDEVIEADLDAAFKPRKRVSDFPHFSVSPEWIGAASTALHAPHMKEWKKAPKLAQHDVDGAWTGVAAGAERSRVLACVDEAEVPAHWWPVKLVWWVRQQEHDGTAPESISALESQPASWEVTKNDGTVERIDAVDDAGERVVHYRMTSMKFGKYANRKSARVEPAYEHGLRAALGISVTTINMASDDAADWDEKLVQHLRRGMPAVAHVKSGRYVPEGEKPGGHYVLVVGYRTIGGVTRFIVNDPAGAKKLQYEAYREQDVPPRVGERSYLTQLGVDVLVTEDGLEVGAGSFSFEEAELLAALDRMPQRRELPLVGTATGSTLVFESETCTRSKDTDKFDGFQYSLALTPRDATREPIAHARAAASVKTLAKGKQSARASASQAVGTLSVELTFDGALEKKEGPCLPKPNEGRWDVLVERRRRDSLLTLFLVAPKGWKHDAEEWQGAARWLVFDGKVEG